jgi:hypothetical protein
MMKHYRVKASITQE